MCELLHTRRRCKLRQLILPGRISDPLEKAKQSAHATRLRRSVRADRDVIGVGRSPGFRERKDSAHPIWTAGLERGRWFADSPLRGNGRERQAGSSDGGLKVRQ